jgi:L-amino acid N-acyltransferase YncA
VLRRTDVSIHACEGGVVTIGRGLMGRFEVGIEVADGYRGKRLGRRLAEAARGLVPGGRPLWAQIAPGNATSLRAFLAAGFAPVGMEALLVTHRGERSTPAGPPRPS